MAKKKDAPPECKGFAPVSPDGRIDPNLIYASEPKLVAEIHRGPVWKVRIVPAKLVIEAD